MMYAPAVPGVVVALAGLWIAHRLTLVRENRKSLLELCEQVKERCDAAAIACATAWLSEKGLERERNVKEAKRLLQRVGTAATNLKRRTQPKTSFQQSCSSPLPIDILAEVSELRRVATSDPFEDPIRAADGSHVEIINTVASSICDKIDSSSAHL